MNKRKFQPLQNKQRFQAIYSKNSDDWGTKLRKQYHRPARDQALRRISQLAKNQINHKSHSHSKTNPNNVTFGNRNFKKNQLSFETIPEEKVRKRRKL